MDKISTMELPPLIPDLKEMVESFLLHPEDLPIHSLQETRKYIPRTPDFYRLFEPKFSPLSSTLQVTRDLATGEITGLTEVFNQDTGLTNKNSLSLQRAPGPPDESVRGTSTNLPFWPGGFDPQKLDEELEQNVLIDFSQLLTKHPKLSGGIDFEEDSKKNEQVKLDTSEVNLNILNVLSDDSDTLGVFDVKPVEAPVKQLSELSLDPVADEDVLDTLSDKVPDHNVIKISEGANKGLIVGQGTEWVEILDVNAPVDDFKLKVPDPACSYPFELDVFQKQAIIHLEQQDCVFVAAHTSAGKTVVAEYSIALALKHMTRAIYTSPIKALSNQKYRELKIKFEDVGLLTGDIQINPKASCLIMTTEILQSMLYNGSDIIRDLEWVIFDEVHYINNADRGHVWEEVLIMLPSHVNIVLLSATVPNTVEFADWIGRIKKRKIYVISTTKRPVPLEHYLYTGTGGATKDDRFLIVDSVGTFIKAGYADAMTSKKEKQKKSQQQNYGPKQGQRQMMGDKQEKHMWIGLLDHLGRKDLLPVVAFTLSKKRCDANASNLLSQDLTTKMEKGEIESFIKKCLDRLQGSDKILPQVVHMRELLRAGIGVHHSGILPMLKEVVEMLFAKGLVKILFATETFAMGVNMPARSVVFDSIRKHDGTGMRDLIPSEYIQMAGRAGRRGLDTTGTVIILCKNDVPEMADLHQMMLGKPSKLESQFKLTYSMILNLLRIEALRVEDMMKRSFSECIQLMNQSKYADVLDKLTKEVSGQEDLKCVMCENIKDYYSISHDLLTQRKKVYNLVSGHANVSRLLQPGRLLVISYSKYQNYLACLLKVDQRQKDKFVVFILNDRCDDSKVDENAQKIDQCLAAREAIHIVSETSDHELLDIGPSAIVAISDIHLKISPDKIIDNINKRKIPRFMNDPPGQSTLDLIGELQRIHENGASGITLYSLMTDLGIKDIDSVTEVECLETMKAKLASQTCLECPQFVDHFKQAFSYLKAREEIGRLKYLMSEESLQLHPEYQMRIEVLNKLGYIEDNKTVTLKGRIACEMGNHELMVTELLLENVFADKPIEEIVALLSSLVFQQKFCSEPVLKANLEAGIKEFKGIALKIGKMQRECGLLEPVGDFVDQFNFGLVEVVYEWAHGMPFNKIMELTDVQEGVTVKCIQRLDEALRAVRNSAKIVGDTNLVEKMEKASAAIKRDIVFAASLYTQ